MGQGNVLPRSNSRGDARTMGSQIRHARSTPSTYQLVEGAGDVFEPEAVGNASNQGKSTRIMDKNNRLVQQTRGAGNASFGRRTRLPVTPSLPVMQNKPNPIKILLFGPAEVGKTTIIRKVMMLNGQDMLQERQQFKPYILFNIVEGFGLCLNAAAKTFRIKFTDPEDIKHRELILNLCYKFREHPEHFNLDLIDSDDNQVDEPSNNTIPVEQTLAAIKHLYTQSGTFQQVLSRRTDFALFDSWFHFVENLIAHYPTWGGKDWIPSQDDFLMARVRTISERDYSFRIGDTEYSLTDVAGQRTEQAKFYFLFSKMDCLLFVGSLSEYCEILTEDAGENRLRETLRLWSSTLDHPDFKSTFVILFLNKVDLFRKKYFHERIPIELQFKYKYSPPRVEDEKDESCDIALKWFQHLFRSTAPEKKQNDIKIFITSAFDSITLAGVVRETAQILKNRAQFDNLL